MPQRVRSPKEIIVSLLKIEAWQLSLSKRGLQAWEPHTAHTIRNKAQEVFLQRFGWILLFLIIIFLLCYVRHH